MQLGLVGIGLTGLLLGSLLRERPGVLGMLNLLGWAAGQAGSLAWSAVKSDKDMAGSILGKSSWAQLHCHDVTRPCQYAWRAGGPVCYILTSYCMRYILALMHCMHNVIFSGCKGLQVGMMEVWLCSPSCLA